MSKKEWNKIFKEKCKKFNILPSVLPPVKRIIVLGDLHGDWDITINSLKIAKLINNKLNWIGSDTVVVQLGDQIDRCRFTDIPCNLPNATKDDEASDMRILNYFTKLHGQAQKKGGAVYSIIGNHELMNVNGDMRYVSFKNISDFNNYKKPDRSIISDGMKARTWAFSPGNPIADFLGCTRQLSLIIGSNLFVHAGILPNIAKKYNIKKMNQILSLYLWNKLKNPSDYNELLDSADYSPLWNRIFATTHQSTNLTIPSLTTPSLTTPSLTTHSLTNLSTPLSTHLSKDDLSKTCNNLMDPLKQIYKVGKIFIGHTPQLTTGISNTCDKRIWHVDYGASKAFDKFDKNFKSSNKRSKVREVQVLEILDDGEIINIIK